MLIRDKENKKKYIVYGFYGINDNIVYITYENKYSPLNFIPATDCEVLDDVHSTYWKKYEDNTFLPKGWGDANFLYELVDDLEPLTTEKFKVAKDKIDKEFSYYFTDDENCQNEDIKVSAMPIGENWVLCPECDEAFEADKEKKVIQCPNIACREKLNNPYV